ncbi:MAG: hypothetical protein JWM74_493 [Myxococcaceae bacterium]|jgi:hypothetical protein|nr:hypothetical protein [Myxococcaceae bacterium]
MVARSMAWLWLKRLTLAAPCATAVVLGSTRAEAADPLGATQPVRPIGGAIDEPAEAAEHKLSYWADTKPRWFVSGYLEGGAYLKPQLQAGYGQPHWIWVGVDAYPVVTFAFAGAYAGFRFSLPIFDMKIGARNSLSFDRSYLTRKPTYEANDVDHVHDHGQVRYTTIEGNISGVVPLPHSYLVASVDAYYLPDVPNGLDMYEESLRVVARAPWVIGNRVAYAVKLGKNGFIKAGVLGELVLVPKREAVTWRVGPAAIVNITDHLDGLIALSLPVSSTDHLGIFEGSFGVLGVSYAWATGDEHPRFP